MNINLGWQVTEETRIDVNIPHHTLETHAPMSPLGGPVDAEVSGLGDITIAALWNPWAGEEHKEDSGLWNDIIHHEHLRFIVGLKLPTGEENEDAFRKRAAEFRSLGTGTTDAILGLTYFAPVAENVVIFESITWTIPLNKNSQQPPGNGSFTGVRPGDVVFNRLGVSWAPIEWANVFLSYDWQWRDEDQDNPQTATGGTGGVFGYVTPGFTLNYEGWAFEFHAQIRIHENANGLRQLVGGDVFNIGLTKTF